MNKIRSTRYAGSFYSSDSETLRLQIHNFLQVELPNLPIPKCLIVPHAGYIYSGEVAGYSYRLMQKYLSEIKQIILVGPSHHFGVAQIFSTEYSGFDSPLGLLEINKEINSRGNALEKLRPSDRVHDPEHSLEVQIPFLKFLNTNATFSPFIFGPVNTDISANFYRQLWDDKSSIFLISSDLSHFLNYSEAQKKDAQTAECIEQLNADALGENAACGIHPLQGFLKVAKEKQLTVQRLAMNNSGDTAGDRSRVVGYGAWAFFEE